MSKRQPKVLVIGSGPIVIGQAAEFDYAGTQACKSLREEGIFTVLVNSNPATIMTDNETADTIYIEPLTVEVLTRIIESERPTGILPTMGGQTGLNLAVDLAEAGVLNRYDVKLLGTSLKAIKTAEDRELFSQMLSDILEPQPASVTANSMDEARQAVSTLSGLPLVIRPAYTLGGTGGGIAQSMKQLESIASSGLKASPINQVLIEKSLAGWKELEYEVVRDGDNNCITVCNMENIDPMGVHTGDSIVVAPSQTLSDKEHQMLRTASLKIISALGIEGGCNIQFALPPNNLVAETLPNKSQEDSPYYVIEVNPRVSRSSALASKATGYPIARVAAKIAAGKRLDEIPNAVTKITSAAFEPALDYCVVKIPRWPFDKFPRGDRTIGTQMKATGEVMAIDRSFEAAFQKAMRSLEITNRSVLWKNPQWKNDPQFIDKHLPLYPNDERIWALLFALRNGITPEALSKRTAIDPWFTRALGRITTMETRIESEKLSPSLLFDAKRLGFSDEHIATLIGKSSKSIRKLRAKYDIRPVYKMVDTCAAEFEAQTPYFYSSYEQENEASPIEKQKAVVIGSGPIRIGQGIEFDYCSVHAARELQRLGIQSIMVNSNPETVSTDFDSSNRLYFEPLDNESIQDILENESYAHKENPSGIIPPPTVVQFGGQTAINLSQSLDKANFPILGSTAQSIDIASDRHLFEGFLKRVGISHPPGGTVHTLEQAIQVATDIGYPVLVRPSYVLGGRAMEIVQGDLEMKKYMAEALEAGDGRGVLVDKYFEGKEVEVDAVCDGETVLIPGIMEHIERAGVHSGDSMAIYPSLTLSENEVSSIVDYTTRIGLALGVRGLMNVQYVILGGPSYRNLSSNTTVTRQDNTGVYVIEVNPRASRTIPFISKLTGIPMVRLAINAMLGNTIESQGYTGGLCQNKNLVGIKAPVFSMSKLAGVDTYLGPEMKSTGEVMGIDYTFEAAMAKALISAGLSIPLGGSILLSIADKNKSEAIPMLKTLASANCKLYATAGTAALIKKTGISVVDVPKRLNEGHPNVVDIIMDGTVAAVVNTVTGNRESMQDGFEIRRVAAERRVPCFTSIDTARAAIENLTGNPGKYNVKPLASYLQHS